MAGQALQLVALVCVAVAWGQRVGSGIESKLWIEMGTVTVTSEIRPSSIAPVNAKLLLALSGTSFWLRSAPCSGDKPIAVVSKTKTRPGDIRNRPHDELWPLELDRHQPSDGVLERHQSVTSESFPAPFFVLFVTKKVSPKVSPTPETNQGCRSRLVVSHSVEMSCIESG